MIRIGILGDIGSGKSYIAKNFGYPVFNADLEVSKLYKNDRKIFIKLKKNLSKYIYSFPINKKEISKAILAKKSNLNKFWKGADPQKQGFTSDGVIVGQCWDGPITSMRAAGEPVAYRTTDEGALAWVDGISMSVGAENIDEAYALINFSFPPEIGAETVNTIGYNSAIIGASDLYSQETKDKTAFVYPGETLANLNPWPAEPQWFLDLRAEYANKFQTA